MYCKHCGKEISETARFCDECGKPVSEEYALVQQKEGVRRCPNCGESVNQYAQICRNCGQDLASNVITKKKKKKPIGCFVWAIVILVLFGSCGAILGTSDSENSDVAIETEEKHPQTEPTISTTEIIATSNNTAMENAISQIDAILKENSTNYNISYDETGISINFWQDGIAKEASMAISGNNNYLKSWNNMIDSFMNMSNSFRTFLDKEGLEDVTLILNLLNDQNIENVLATIVDSTLVYDFVSENTSNASATIGESNALKKAHSYLSFTAFSYTGLIEQLEYEGFTKEEATYGADNCGADWFEQAVKKAESYLSLTSFSKQKLIEQLEYEGFTHEQAVYGVEQNGF